jgi:hypothetical protein
VPRCFVPTNSLRTAAAIGPMVVGCTRVMTVRCLLRLPVGARKVVELGLHTLVGGMGEEGQL